MKNPKTNLAKELNIRFVESVKNLSLLFLKAVDKC
jgi:hypothetical protein